MKYIQPLKISKRQSGRVKKEGMTAFHALTPVWMDELRKTGHGGEWGPERYRDDGPVIYASEANDTKKIGIVEAMNRVADEKKVFILPTTKSISIKQNPEMDWVDVRKSTEAVEMYENKELMNSLYPDLGELTLATMMQERGPFRASFEAQSGKGVPYGSNVKITGETNKRIRAQVLGIQPTSAEKLSAKQTKELRRRIRSRIYSKYANFIKEKAVELEKDPEEYLKELKSGISEIGATEESLMEAILSGHHKYIDRSETTVNDFQRMVSGYTQIRRANGPFLKKIMPKLSQGMKSLELFEGFNTKFLDAIAPTADYMLQPGVIHAIIDIEGKVVTPNDIWESSFLRLLTGESLTQVSDPAYVKADLNKAAYRFLASHDHNTEAAAKAILMASRNAFLSDKGVIDIGIKILQVDKISDAIDKANSDRVGSKPFTKIFEIDSPNIKKRNEIMQNLVSRGLAFPIPTSKKMSKKMSKEKKVEYSGKDSAFFLVPLFSSGFTKQPKGWDSRWVVPTFQILEEYSDVMKGGSMPSALELLYMIATRAKAIYDYEINESETMLLYSMLDPHDPKVDKKSPMQLLEEDIEELKREETKLKKELSTTKSKATKEKNSKEKLQKELEEKKKEKEELKKQLEETEKLLTAKKEKVETLKAAEDLFGPITPVVREKIVVPEPFEGPVRAPSEGDVKAAFSNPALSNPPANILPTGVSPSDLGDPFNEAHAEYIFKLLTRKATAAVTEKREKLVNKVKDVMSPGEFKKLKLDELSNEDLEKLITINKPKTPSKSSSGKKPNIKSTQGFAFSPTGAGLKTDSEVEVDGKKVKFESIKSDLEKMTKVLLAMGHTTENGQWKKATTTSRAGLSMAPPSVVKASSKKDAISQRELLLQEGFDYKVMVKGKNYLLASESSIGEAERKGYKVVSIDSFMGSKAMTMARSKTNPPFEVNEMVRYNGNDKYPKLKKGEIYTIKAISFFKDEYHLFFERQKELGLGNKGFKARSFDRLLHHSAWLAPEGGSPMSNPPFEVNEMVRYNGNDKYPKLKKGEIYTITEIDQQNFHTTFKLANQGNKDFNSVSFDRIGAYGMMAPEGGSPMSNPAGVSFALSRQFQRWANKDDYWDEKYQVWEKNFNRRIIDADKEQRVSIRTDPSAIDSHIRFPKGTEGYDMFMYALPGALGAKSWVNYPSSESGKQIKEQIEVFLERLYGRLITYHHFSKAEGNDYDFIFLTLAPIGSVIDPRHIKNPRGLSRTLAKAAAETRASKLNKTIYCVKGEDKKWHIKESRPNSGEYFEVKPNPNDEGIIRSEMMEPVWKMRVRYILDQEGGASGLAPLMEAFPKGTTNKEARKMLTKIHDVRKHRSGDYIWENPEAKLKCTYRKTKRSKPCGSEVKMMRNGRLYKCGKCGAKYEMR